MTGPLRWKVKAEHGQSMVIVTLAMVAVLAMCALAIDVGIWFEQHHQAQVAADAAALAAVQDLGQGNCQTSTQTQNEILSDVNAYGKTENGALTVTYACPYESSAYEVHVTASKTGPIFFSSLFGIPGPTITASAVARETTGTKTTTTTTAGDLAMFAMDTTCNITKGATGPGNGVTVTANGATINGAIQSEGALNLNGDSQTTFTGPTIEYKNGSGCLGSKKGTLPSGQPSFSTPTTTWPVCYTVPATVWSADSSSLPSCSDPASDQYAPVCTYTAGAANPPAGVTSASGGTDLTIDGNVTGVFCAPSGTITVASGTINAELFAQQVNSVPNTATLNYNPTQEGVDSQLLTYCMGPTTSGGGSPCTFGGNSSTYDGAVFVPNSFIVFTANTSDTGFLEAQDVAFEGNSSSGFVGTGGTTTTTTTTTTYGTAGALIQ